MTPERTGQITIPAWLLYLIVSIAGLAISGFVAYAAASSSMNARVSVLEEQRKYIDKRLDSIEHKLDELLERTPQR